MVDRSPKHQDTKKHAPSTGHAASVPQVNKESDYCVLKDNRYTSLYTSDGKTLPLDKKLAVVTREDLRCIAHAAAEQRGLPEAEVLKRLNTAYDDAKSHGKKSGKTVVIDVPKIVTNQRLAHTDPVLSKPEHPNNTARHGASISTPHVAPEASKQPEDQASRYTPVPKRPFLEQATVFFQNALNDPRQAFFSTMTEGTWSRGGTTYTAKEKETLWGVLKAARDSSPDPEVRNTPVRVLVKVANDFRAKSPNIRLADGSLFDLRADDGSLLALQRGESINVAAILDIERIRSATEVLRREPRIGHTVLGGGAQISRREPISPGERQVILASRSEPEYQQPYRFGPTGIRALVSSVNSVITHERGRSAVMPDRILVGQAFGESGFFILAKGGLGEIGLTQPLPDTARSIFPSTFPQEIVQLAEEYQVHLPKHLQVSLKHLLSEPPQGKSHFSEKIMYNPVINVYLGANYLADQLANARSDIASGTKYKRITALPADQELALRYYNGGQHGVRDWRSRGSDGVKTIRNTAAYVRHVEKNAREFDNKSSGGSLRYARNNNAPTRESDE